MEYPPRIYDFTLHIVGLIVGAALIVGHLYALLRTAETQKWLVKLPRSKSARLGSWRLTRCGASGWSLVSI